MRKRNIQWDGTCVCEAEEVNVGLHTRKTIMAEPNTCILCRNIFQILTRLAGMLQIV